MGEIVYCNTCGDRILTADFEKGRAVVILKRNYCANCAKGVKDPEKEPAKEAPARKERRATVRIPVAQSNWRRHLFIILGISILLLALIIVVVTKR